MEVMVEVSGGGQWWRSVMEVSGGGSDSCSVVVWRGDLGGPDWLTLKLIEDGTVA
jgi:hypothetical protein